MHDTSNCSIHDVVGYEIHDEYPMQIIDVTLSFILSSGGRSLHRNRYHSGEYL